MAKLKSGLRLISWLRLIRLYSINQLFMLFKMINTIETDYGHRLSFVNQKPSWKGRPSPWFNYPFLEFLSSLDLTRKKIFEYGTGVGSSYWKNVGKMYAGVESDPKWYLKLSHLGNIALETSKSKYVKSIAYWRMKFNIIVVDGDYRWDCVKTALKYLTDDGIIILDNAEWYPKCCKWLRRRGFFQIDFSGFGPAAYLPWKTSLFLRKLSSLRYGPSNYVPVGFEPTTSITE